MGVARILKAGRFLKNPGFHGEFQRYFSQKGVVRVLRPPLAMPMGWSFVYPDPLAMPMGWLFVYPSPLAMSMGCSFVYTTPGDAHGVVVRVPRPLLAMPMGWSFMYPDPLG
jgi:hypothetical protein